LTAAQDAAMPAFHEQVRDLLPRLTADNYRVTSPATWDYNCIAWAAGVTDAWWWPTPGRYWPPNVPREESLAAFLAAFATLGYTPGTPPVSEPGVEKVALYAVGNTPTHAAQLLPSGMWTSKLGPAIDIEHTTPDAVAGGAYGEIVAILTREQEGHHSSSP
jgi:hypothetical protein